MNNIETKKCPYCTEEILIQAIKCKHCGSDLSIEKKLSLTSEISKLDETYGNLMLIIPLSFVFLSLYFIDEIRAAQNPIAILKLMATFTDLFTAILASIESSKLGMGNLTDLNSKGKKRIGPIAWFIFIFYVWTIGYPWYLYHRSKYGLKNHVKSGILIMLITILNIIFTLFRINLN